jgi:D-alanyl-D-alanine carboxypeptidase/D-alanyl-D-alanine-endopeptidase (penicillin-binding protein 4)
MTCLSAVKVGSTDCLHGLVEEQKTITGFGIPNDEVFLQDGAGSDDQGRTTPFALAEFFRKAASTSYGKALSDGLPVMGKTGLLADVLSKSPFAGHSQAKTGSRVVGTPAGQIIMLGNSIAGYIQTKSGRDVTYMIVVGNVPLSSTDDVLPIGVQQARMAEAIYRSL